MGVEVLLPKLGLTMEEGTIDAWLVDAGDLVAVGDPILRLATDKVDVDVEAEAAGRFHPAVPAGTTLPPGAVVAWLLADGEDPPASSAAPAAGAPTADATPTGAGRLKSSPLARTLAGELEVDLATVSGTGPGGRVVADDVRASAGTASRRVDAEGGSPLVRRDAREHGVDLGSVRGSGVGGRITRDDVRATAGAGAAQPLARQVTEVIPLKGMRGAIASRMMASLHEMAQLTHGFDVRMDEVVALRTELKRDWGDRAIAVPSLNDFIVRAAALALREHPRLNATVVGDEIHVLSAIHIGLAVAVPHGLLVPVVRDADQLPLRLLAERTRSLAAAAREGRLGLGDLEGATFAVTSLGTYGVDFFTPVINPGNVAILGVGRLRDGVRWVDDRPVRTQVLTLSLTFDHRAVDGAPAAEYLQGVAELLARPLGLLPGD